MIFNKNNSRQKLAVTDDFKAFLKNNNCQFEAKPDEGNEGTQYHFSYQGGQYLAYIPKHDGRVTISYPCFASSPLSAIDNVRSNCNDFNNRVSMFKCVYEIDVEDNTISVSLEFTMNKIVEKDLRFALESCFYFQRQWAEGVEKSKEDPDKNVDDLEVRGAIYNRELYLIHQQALDHQTRAITATGTDKVALHRMILELWSLPTDARYTRLTVQQGTQIREITDTTEIANFDMRRALIIGEGENAEFAADTAVLTLHYASAENPNGIVTFTVTDEGEENNTLFTLVTFCAVPNRISAVNPLRRPRRRAQEPVTSFLLAYPKRDDTQLRKEFEFMKKEAEDKLADDASTLTDDEKLLVRATNGDLASDIYWGGTHMGNACFAQALAHYLNAFDLCQPELLNMKEDDQRMFFELCYRIGSCYCSLGLYRQAYYYLALTKDDGVVKHAMALINALANSKDARIFPVTDEIFGTIKKNWENQDDAPEGIRNFVNFMYCRRASALIDFGKLDEAEERFNKLLDDPKYGDVAINELAYIKQLREQQTAEAPQPDTH